MNDALIVSLLSVVPRNRGARLMGWCARSGLSGLATRLFARVYGVDLAEAEHGIEAYPTLEALFTRRLKAGARPVDPAPGAWVSPADGRVAWAGRTEGGELEISPGRPLSLQALLGEPVEGERDVIVVYLSPKDYHRVHAPCAGRVAAWRYLPGTLWPVFPAAVRRITGLFAKNERVSVQLETEFGRVDVVLVGAFGVGRMSLAFADLMTNTGGQACRVEPPTRTDLVRGGDLGVFHLGSTVVLIAPGGAAAWEATPGQDVRMGSRIGGRGTAPGSTS